jgi:hypothetical protein
MRPPGLMAATSEHFHDPRSGSPKKLLHRSALLDLAIVAASAPFAQAAYARKTRNHSLPILWRVMSLTSAPPRGLVHKSVHKPILDLRVLRNLAIAAPPLPVTAPRAPCESGANQLLFVVDTCFAGAAVAAGEVAAKIFQGAPPHGEHVCSAAASLDKVRRRPTWVASRPNRAARPSGPGRNRAPRPHPASALIVARRSVLLGRRPPSRALGRRLCRPGPGGSDAPPSAGGPREARHVDQPSDSTGAARRPGHHGQHGRRSVTAAGLRRSSRKFRLPLDTGIRPRRQPGRVDRVRLPDPGTA